ncbi:MAG: Gfo/Idh/MocA family oxidoreductase [Clostridia bacterium]|nr:Gfo/Idh/MocA family oxidoreductase [Clostridia bacterium]
MAKIRVGLIGIGGMGGCHFYNYDQVPNAEIVAVCDVREDVAKEKVGDRNINIYTDYNKMIRKEELDMIDICTPSFLHADMAVKLLKKGYHVLCEKPMTLNAKDAKRVCVVAKQEEKNFMVAHVVRFMTPYAYLRNVIESGELGKLIRLDMKRISAIPQWSWQDWMRDEKLSGGVVTDLSIHDFDFVQSVLGMPQKIESYRYQMTNNNDTVVTNMIYDGDTLVSCEGTWYNTNIPFDAGFLAVFQNGYVELSKGKLVKNGEEVQLNKAECAQNDLGINVGNDNGYLAEIQYFVDCIEKGKKPELVTPDSSMQSVVLADMIKKKATILKQKRKM